MYLSVTAMVVKNVSLDEGATLIHNTILSLYQDMTGLLLFVLCRFLPFIYFVYSHLQWLTVNGLSRLIESLIPNPAQAVQEDKKNPPRQLVAFLKKTSKELINIEEKLGWLLWQWV